MSWSASAPIVLHVTYADGSEDRVEWPAGSGVVQIGASPLSHLRLRGEGHHLVETLLWLARGQVIVMDPPSARTRVDGKEGPHRAPLVDGCLLELGTTRVRIEIPPGALAELELELKELADADAKGRCPRCQQRLDEARAEPTGGYRDEPMHFDRCEPCKLSVLRASTLQARYGHVPAYSELAAFHAQKPAGKPCPACLRGLTEITLHDAPSWVVFEACPGCGCIVLEDGEGLALDAMLARPAR